MASRNPLTVEVTRGGMVESRHRGAAVVMDAKGNAVHAWGEIERIVYPRSAIKPLQTLVLIKTGAADAYQQAADAIPYEMIRSQYLLDLGRAASTGGDTARAAAAYERIIEDDADPQAITEAKFRLAELRPRSESESES